MRFELYSDKTLPQCIAALQERMQVKGTPSRPAISGWTEKDGRFSLASSSPVVGNFNRMTRLRGKIEKDKGFTRITGFVPDGLDRRTQIILFGVTVAVCGLMVLSGLLFLGIVIALAALAFYVPLMGDYTNSDYLMKELKKTLGTKSSPPKVTLAPKPAPMKAAVPTKPGGMKPTAVKPGAVNKPVAKK